MKVFPISLSFGNSVKVPPIEVIGTPIFGETPQVTLETLILKTDITLHETGSFQGRTSFFTESTSINTFGGGPMFDVDAFSNVIVSILLADSTQKTLLMLHENILFKYRFPSFHDWVRQVPLNILKQVEGIAIIHTEQFEFQRIDLTSDNAEWKSFIQEV